MAADFLLKYVWETTPMDASHFLFRVVDRGVHRGQRGIKIVLADVAFGAFRENHDLAIGSSSGCLAMRKLRIEAMFFYQ